MAHSGAETEKGASPSSPTITSPCTKRISCRPNQVRQRKRPTSMPFRASTMLLLCLHSRRSRLRRKTSGMIRGAPQRRRGVWGRGRRSIWVEREGRGAMEEECTWIGRGRGAGSARKKRPWHTHVKEKLKEIADRTSAGQSYFYFFLYRLYDVPNSS